VAFAQEALGESGRQVLQRLVEEVAANHVEEAAEEVEAGAGELHAWSQAEAAEEGAAEGLHVWSQVDQAHQEAAEVGELHVSSRAAAEEAEEFRIAAHDQHALRA
jgi:hypothetical protein